MFDRDPIAPAEICSQERHAEIGGAVWWFVRLANGHLVDCGTNMSDANKIARAINLIPVIEALSDRNIDEMAANMRSNEAIGARWDDLSEKDKMFYRYVAIRRVISNAP